MYKKIMVPLDGSELAECVLPHAKAILEGCKPQQIVLVRVLEPQALYYGEYNINPEMITEKEAERKAEAQKYLDQVTERLSAGGTELRTEVITGRVAEGLVDYAVGNEVDLILIATHGRSGVTRWVRGSVADKMLRSSRIPILMVRAPGTEKGV